MLEADLGKHGLPRLIGVLDLVRGMAASLTSKPRSSLLTLIESPIKQRFKPPATRFVQGCDWSARSWLRNPFPREDQDSSAGGDIAATQYSRATNPVVPNHGGVHGRFGSTGLRAVAGPSVRQLSVLQRVSSLELNQSWAVLACRPSTTKNRREVMPEVKKRVAVTLCSIVSTFSK